MRQDVAQTVRTGIVVTLIGLTVGAASCSPPPGGDAGDVDAESDVTDTEPGSETQDGGDIDGDTSDAGEDTGPPGEEVQIDTFGVFPPLASECGAPGARRKIPFYFLTRQGNTIRPVRSGDVLQGELLEANRTVTAGALSTRRIRVGEAATRSCRGRTCQSPFKCGPSGVRGAGARCQRQSGVQFIPGTVRQDYKPNISSDSGQLISIVLENNLGWQGYIPGLVATKYNKDNERSFQKIPSIASDPDEKRKEAIELFARNLATAAKPENTKVGMWFFGGENPIQDVRPMVNTRGEDHFTDALERPKALVKGLPSPPKNPSNVYQAMLRVANDGFGLDKYKNHEKFMVVLTDGPNEVFDNDATRKKALNKLKKMGIHLYIIHLDAEIDPSKLRDDPRYWQGTKECRRDNSCQGALPCSSDDDCGNHETCRKATIYKDKKSGTVRQTGQKFCMPDYSGGRLGPVSAYSDFACATNGNYLYTTKPEQMKYYARRIPFLLDGQWSVTAEFSALSDKVGLSDGYYRLSGAFVGLLAPNLVQIFSLPSDRGKIQPLRDTRPVMRKGLVPGK